MHSMPMLGINAFLFVYKETPLSTLKVFKGIIFSI